MDNFMSKRGYAVGKLQRFLKEKGLTKQFRENCKNNHQVKKGNKTLCEAFIWSKTPEGSKFWSNLEEEYEKW